MLFKFKRGRLWEELVLSLSRSSVTDTDILHLCTKWVDRSGTELQFWGNVGVILAEALVAKMLNQFHRHYVAFKANLCASRAAFSI